MSFCHAREEDPEEAAEEAVEEAVEEAAEEAAGVVDMPAPRKDQCILEQRKCPF